ncbi:MAG: hypothetical protein ACFNWY_01410 [Negativicutes bacterium]
MADKEKGKEEKEKEATYTREALAESKRYRDKWDVVMVALEDGREYTMAEAEAKIDAFLAAPVKEAVNGRDS